MLSKRGMHPVYADLISAYAQLFRNWHCVLKYTQLKLSHRGNTVCTVHYLKVHKREKFFVSDFELFTIL